VTLRYPDSDLLPGVTKLTLRKPRAKDVGLASRNGDSSGDIEINLFASLCEVDVSIIENLEMFDYVALQKKYGEMEAGKHAPAGETSS